MDSHATAPRVKEIAEEYTNGVWNTKNLNVIDKYIVSEAVIHSLLGDFQGPQAMKEVVQAWLKGFPDMRVQNENVIVERDLAVVQWQVQATHLEEFKGFKPSGKKVHYSGVTIYRVKHEKIVEYWAYIDMKHLLRQISPS